MIMGGVPEAKESLANWADDLREVDKRGEDRSHAFP